MPKRALCQTGLKEMHENKMQGILIRSRANIFGDGEKPTKFFVIWKQTIIQVRQLMF